MKTVITLLLFFIFTLNGICQQPASIESNKAVKYGSMERVRQPGQDYPDYPRLQLSENSKAIELPAVVDNSNLPYLRPVYDQMHEATCEQDATILYNFCYEINRMRQLPSDTITNQFPEHFAYNFMTSIVDYGFSGVNYFHTFDIMYDAGSPTISMYGDIRGALHWMSGYEGYFQAMHNRISGISSIYTGTPDGLLVLKHWLNDHLDGSETGGVATYSADESYGPKILPEGTPEAGKHVHEIFGETAGHAMTIVGYNDSIRYDVNGDGIFTNNLDITGDTVVDMCDWEIGGFKMINSFGIYWADSGFCYVLYRTLAMKYGEGGIWNNSVHIIHPDTTAKPLLTIKATIRHNNRGMIRLLAGIATDSTNYNPTVTQSFSIFNYQGGDHYMDGSHVSSGETLELGLDISPLLSHVRGNEPFRIFLMVDEKDSENKGNGSLLDFSVLNNMNQEVIEFQSPDVPMALLDNDRTFASVVVNAAVNPVDFQPNGPIVLSTQNDTSIQFTASGGFPPYSWSLNPFYTETESHANYSTSDGTMLEPTDDNAGFAEVPLPFSFPFFGQEYDTLYMHVNGYILFDRQDMPYYYLLYDDNYMKQIRVISGYMNHGLALNHIEDNISYKSYTDSLVFHWRISANEDSGTVNFSTTVFPDGRIQHHYGQIDAQLTLPPVIGLGDGSRNSSYFSRKNKIIPTEGDIIRFIPSALPENISISNDGLLFVEAGTTGFSDKITIQLTDTQRLYQERNITLTSGPEVKIRLADSLALLRPGEVAPLLIEVFNHGNDTIKGLLLNIKPTSRSCSINGNDTEGINLLPGQSVRIEDKFSLRISDTVTRPQIVGVELTGTLDYFVFHSFQDFQLDVPVFSIMPPVVVDGNNKRIEPGEKALLMFKVYNLGNAPEGRLRVKVSTDDPFVGISGKDVFETEELKGSGMFQVIPVVQTNVSTPNGTIIRIRLDIYLHETRILTKEFELEIGKSPILICDISKYHNLTTSLESDLRDLNISYARSIKINDEILTNDILFFNMGIGSYNISPNQHEDSLLVHFMDNGGNIFSEGGIYLLQPSQYKDRLHIDVGLDAVTIPPDTIMGITDTPVEGLQFDYSGPFSYILNLLPIEPAEAWMADKNSGLNFIAAYDNGNYRSLFSSMYYGGLQSIHGSDRRELLRRYLEFLGYPTNPLAANFKADSTFICKGSDVHFEPFCNGNPTNFHWTFEGGAPSEYEGPNPVITYETEGYFGVTLTVSDGQTSNTFSLENFIMVDQCIGIPEEKYPTLVLYPNPANEMITIRTGTLTGNQAILIVSDLSGRVVLRQAVAAGLTEIQLPVSTLRPGCYLITFTDANHRQSAVMIR
ncbi:MAG: PKD domain-containing protein [Bacteroidales bacterium]|nr:PKD domain-containing protein [Bacteroidales bacterium]